MKKTIFKTWLILAIFFSSYNYVWAAEADSAANLTPNNSINTEIVEGYGSKLYTAIKVARDNLQTIIDQAELNQVKPKVVTSYSAVIDAKFALWNKKTNDLKFVDAKKTDKKIISDTDSGLDIKIKFANGVNTQYEVSNPDWLILAAIHPIYTNKGTAKKPKYQLNNVIYTPYQDYLADPFIVKAGQDFLSQKVEAVIAELKNLRVRSKAYPYQLLTDTIDAALVKSIIAIEHVSAASLLTGNVEDQLSKFYVILATNEHKAYAYSKSSASARGLVQFIPSTYKSVTKIRSDLTLNKNFEQGMIDPYNAIKAQIGLLDINLSALPQVVKDKYSHDYKALGAYLAAVYNGGNTRVNKAVKIWGDEWAKDHKSAKVEYQKQYNTAKAEVSMLNKLLTNKKLTAAEKTKLQLSLKTAKANMAALLNKVNSATAANLKSETIQYVAKYYLVYDYFKKDGVELALLSTSNREL